MTAEDKALSNLLWMIKNRRFYNIMIIETTKYAGVYKNILKR